MVSLTSNSDATKPGRDGRDPPRIRRTYRDLLRGGQPARAHPRRTLARAARAAPAGPARGRSARRRACRGRWSPSARGSRRPRARSRARTLVNRSSHSSTSRSSGPPSRGRRRGSPRAGPSREELDVDVRVDLGHLRGRRATALETPEVVHAGAQAVEVRQARARRSPRAGSGRRRPRRQRQRGRLTDRQADDADRQRAQVVLLGRGDAVPVAVAAQDGRNSSGGRTCTSRLDQG